MDAFVKKNQLSLRLSDEELERARRLAGHFGLGVQQTVRLLLKREADALTCARERAARER